VSGEPLLKRQPVAVSDRVQPAGAEGQATAFHPDGALTASERTDAPVLWTVT
jgi:hypothetical protein